MIFDIIYNYFYDLFNSQNISAYSTEIMGVSTSLPTWLATTTTLIIMGLLIVFMVLIVRWCFRITAGLFRGL